MKCLRTFALLLALAAWPCTGSGQSLERSVRWGDNAMRLGDPFSAITFYREALDMEPGSLDLQWKCAEALRATNDYAEAAAMYAKVQRKDNGRRYPEVFRWHAEMLTAAGRYDEALPLWRKARQKSKSNSAAAARADHAMEGILQHTGGVPRDDAPVVRPLDAPVNSDASEFAPRIGPDGLLYFTTLRGETDADGAVLDTSAYRSSVLSAAVDADPGDQVRTVLAVPMAHAANSAWSLDGAWYYFSLCPGSAPCTLHAAPWAAGSAGSPRAVRGLGAMAFSTQPMVAEVDSRQAIFFTAAGMHGDMDIWRAWLQGDELSEPTRLPAPVNTPGNECTPFFDSSTGTLHFASDHLPGMGGFDIFTSARSADGDWGPAQNPGAPLNSSANDLYPAVEAGGQAGWFASNRAGGHARDSNTCCNDIYRFEPAGGAISTPPPEPHPAQDSVPATAEAWTGFFSTHLPLRLYFHNDEPSPRTFDTTTTLDYQRTYTAYRERLPDYTKAWQGADTTAFTGFFSRHVSKGMNALEELLPELERALSQGHGITLHVRGFASPLAKGDYNRNLSLRRIDALRNTMARYQAGALRPYLSGTAANGGSLTIVAHPYGKSKADLNVSDRLDDLRNSVYSVGAALERRIEVEAVSVVPQAP